MSIPACHPRTDPAIAAKQRLPLRGGCLTGEDDSVESEVSTTNFTNEHEFSAFVAICEIRGQEFGNADFFDSGGSLQGAGGVGGLLMAEETVISGTTQTAPISHCNHYDGNGNVITITDATGTTEGRYRYSAFGGAANTKATPGSFAATQPYRFSTKYLDKEVQTAEGRFCSEHDCWQDR
jgi:hypothetical protein